jgi:hypothetical protein
MVVSLRGSFRFISALEGFSGRCATITNTKPELALVGHFTQEQQIAVSDLNCLANTLYIKVSSKGKEKVSARIPAELALDLESLMPSDVLDILRMDKTVDLALIQRTIRESGIAPQTIFRHEIGIKQYEIWLE